MKNNIFKMKQRNEERRLFESLSWKSDNSTGSNKEKINTFAIESKNLFAYLVHQYYFRRFYPLFCIVRVEGVRGVQFFVTSQNIAKKLTKNIKVLAN